MILYNLFENESHPAYKKLSTENLERQYSFLESIIVAAIETQQPKISTVLIKALNYHAISCLHINAGEYRSCEVQAGDYKPPQHFYVPKLMNDFIDRVNQIWGQADTLMLAAFCLWRLNFIHPFVNGNGRTARALCYFVVCAKFGSLIRGKPTLPDLIIENRPEYVELLKNVDAEHVESRKGMHKTPPTGLEKLSEFLNRLLEQQIQAIRPQ